MAGPCTAPPRVVMLYDDPPLRAASPIVLEEAGQVYTATTSETGLACLQREPMRLLLLDLRVPTIDGLEGLRPVKVLEAHLPVIIITAVPEVQRAAHAFALGAADSLVQSFDSEIIVRLLRGVFQL